jgi:hypothetical protein
MFAKKIIPPTGGNGTAVVSLIASYFTELLITAYGLTISCKKQDNIYFEESG